MHEQARYPHMLDQDAPVLTAFLKENGARYTSVQFDVRIGSGRDPGPDFEDNIRQMGLDLSRRRIDALGIKPSGIDIIEVTNAAGVTALGQLLAYRALYALQNQTTTIPTPILVARTMQTDMDRPYKASGVELHLYPDV